MYLCPHSPLTCNYADYLAQQGVKVKGFIDNDASKAKTLANVYSANKLPSDLTQLVILSPNHALSLYNQFLPLVGDKKLSIVDFNQGKYQPISPSQLSDNYQPSYLPLNYQGERILWLFVAKTSVTSNLKAFYLYCYQQGQAVSLVTDNQQQLKELKQLNLPAERLFTPQADQLLAEAKYLIFDQGNHPALPPLHPEQKTLQLWHGVGLKKMSMLLKHSYDFFNSTSNWTNSSNFKHIFNAKEFLSLGYPRNDYLVKETAQLTAADKLFTDLKLHSLLTTANYKKIFLYAPTHRSSAPSLNLPELNQLLINKNYLLIIKAHHFYYHLYAQEEITQLSNIYTSPSETDIYPLLNKIDVLIGDYSSINYDFMLLNKPIIYYTPDLATYCKNSPLLFDYQEYSPGIHTHSPAELHQAITNLNLVDYQQKHAQHHQQITNKFFTQAPGKAADNLYTFLKNLSQQA